MMIMLFTFRISAFRFPKCLAWGGGGEREREDCINLIIYLNNYCLRSRKALSYYIASESGIAPGKKYCIIVSFQWTNCLFVVNIFHFFKTVFLYRKYFTFVSFTAFDLNNYRICWIIVNLLFLGFQRDYSLTLHLGMQPPLHTKNPLFVPEV